jgi:hypothetical protein
MTNVVAEITEERPKVYELQICSDELYAFEPLLCDTIYQNKCRIAELRKKIGHFIDQSQTVEMLAEIQSIEGHQVILEDLLSQLSEQGL